MRLAPAPGLGAGTTAALGAGPSGALLTGEPSGATLALARVFRRRGPDPITLWGPLRTAAGVVGPRLALVMIVLGSTMANRRVLAAWNPRPLWRWTRQRHLRQSLFVSRMRTSPPATRRSGRVTRFASFLAATSWTSWKLISGWLCSRWRLTGAAPVSPLMPCAAPSSASTALMAGAWLSGSSPPSNSSSSSPLRPIAIVRSALGGSPSLPPGSSSGPGLASSGPRQSPCAFGSPLRWRASRLMQRVCAPRGRSSRRPAGSRGWPPHRRTNPTNLCSSSQLGQTTPVGFHAPSLCSSPST
ncbi:hypothetical protein PVAP13_9KG547846 [Panicum virgatum]|uniref:Uncharacterized protein n=1 Tax=Panicum virgatum TaxID=38727 RepID=A0A8T0P332_PANVG|nr:hypothetical protein PVAP13_9KG547846 [Panicum virgatum]